MANASTDLKEVAKHLTQRDLDIIILALNSADRSWDRTCATSPDAETAKSFGRMSWEAVTIAAQLEAADFDARDEVVEAR